MIGRVLRVPPVGRIITTRAAGTLAALCLGGCAVGPNYTGPPAPETPNPARYKNAETKGMWKRAAPADADPRGPWWEVFHDPDLTQLEVAAVANNQDLRQSVARIEETRARSRVAAADFYPNAQFDGSAIRQRTSNHLPDQRALATNGIGALSGGGSSGGGARVRTGPTPSSNPPGHETGRRSASAAGW